MTNAAAAGDLPDVVLATPAAQSHQYAVEEIFDSEAAQAVVDKLGPDTFSEAALEIVSRDGVATGVPSDGWGQLLIYRKDLFDKAGLEAPQSLEDVTNAAKQLQGDGLVGITLATAPGRRLHGRDVRAHRARRGLPARRRRRRGDVRLARVRRGAALLRRPRDELLRPGQPGRRLHPRHLLRRARGDDVLVAVPARRHGRAAQRHEAVVQGVQEGSRLPGQEQRPGRAAHRRGRRADPVRPGRDVQHHAPTRRPRTRSRSSSS